LHIISYCVLISARSPEKLPASKVADIVDPKVGVATRIHKPEPADGETSLKQVAAPSTSGRTVDVRQPSSVQETELKQIEPLTSGPVSDVSSAVGLISLHADDQSLPRRAQPDDREHCLYLNSDAATTCSDNYSNFHLHISSQMERIKYCKYLFLHSNCTINCVSTILSLFLQFSGYVKY